MAQFSDQQMLKRFSDAVSVEKPRINAFAQSLEKKKEGGLDLQLIIPHIKEVSNFSAYITNYFNQRWAKIDRVKDFLRLLNGVSYNPDTESPQGNIFYSNAPMMHLIYGAFKDSDITLCKNFATVLNAIYQSVFKSQFLNFSSFTDLEKQKMRPDDKAEDLISKLTNNLDQSPQYSAFSTHEDFDLENIFAPKKQHSHGKSIEKEGIDGEVAPSAGAEHRSDDHVLFIENTADFKKKCSGEDDSFDPSSKHDTAFFGKRSRSESSEKSQLNSVQYKRQKTEEHN